MDLQKAGGRVKRARRRQDLERMKRRSAKLYWGQTKFANHLASCSAYCCGNQRRLEGPKRAERIFMCEPIEGVDMSPGA